MPCVSLACHTELVSLRIVVSGSINRTNVLAPRLPGSAFMDQPDLELVERWRSGDQQAAAQLYQRYVERISHLVTGQLSAKLARRLDAGRCRSIGLSYRIPPLSSRKLHLRGRRRPVEVAGNDFAQQGTLARSPQYEPKARCQPRGTTRRGR